MGYTNEHLAGLLDRALTRKIAIQGNPDAFWASLRVVFCADRLLESIADERLDFPDPGEALRQRRLAAFYGRRSLTVFLRRRIRAARWPIHESSFLPPFTGTLFELPTGQRMIHLLVRSPQRSPSGHLYLEFAETSDQYFTGVFEDIVHNSVADNTIIPVGVPRGRTFERTGTRYRHNVLIDRSGAVGWLAYVLIVIWRQRGGRAEPLLQLCTYANSTRAIDRLMHPATHIYQVDYDTSPAGTVAVPPSQIDLDDAVPKRAAGRRLLLEAGQELPGDLMPVGASQYLNCDREHLYFFVYSRQIPVDFQFPRRAEMHHVPLQELLAILENQALRMADKLLRAPPMSSRARSAATEIVALNLALNGHADVAEQLTAAATHHPWPAEVKAAISDLIERTRQPWVSGGREFDMKGLAGLEYREFFSTLLPLYARLGVPGAADHLASLRADAAFSAAIARLAELYQDVDLITDIPAELLSATGCGADVVPRRQNRIRAGRCGAGLRSLRHALRVGG